MDKYNKIVTPPHYEPSEVQRDISELYKDERYVGFVNEINNSSIRDDEKEFLIKAASRHIEFNFSKIADYYSTATPEMQRLMEKQALVIIDIDDAISNGYCRLTKTITDIVDARRRRDRPEEFNEA